MDHIRIYNIIFIIFFFKLDVIEPFWNTPPFKLPDNHDVAITAIRYYPETKRTIIEFDEEVDHSFCILEIVNFNDPDEPQIGRFDNGNNDLLGAFLKNENGIWKIYINNKQDYEYIPMRKYVFFVTSSSSSYSININVNNIDDNLPIIRPNQQSCAIKENYEGTINCSYTISDADGFVDKTTFTFTSTPLDGKDTFDFIFHTDSDNERRAFLKLQKPLDFETTAMYMLTLKATDTGNNEGYFTSVIQVIDMPDELPKWMRLTASETIKEKTNHTLEISAIDGDIQINAEINYRIKAQREEENDLILIDNKTGKIIIHPINRDQLQKEVFKFQVFAYEKDDIQSEINTTIIIIVDDINDNIPTIFPEKNLSITVREESYITLNFSPPIFISDPDLADHAQYSVYLKDDSKYNWSDAFLIIPNTGYQTTNFTISVVNAPLLDYEDENWRNIQIQIEAIEAHDPSHIGRRTIDINLENWNDEWPIFEHETLEVTVPEDVGINENIAIMLATDLDINDTVKHSLIAQKDLTINQKSGQITTNKENSLDYESMPTFLVQVVATDLVNHTAYGTLIINVKDVNDVPPKLYLPDSIISLKEETSLNTPVEVTITANDPDTDAKLIFDIDWDTTKAFKSSVIVNQSYYYKCLTIQTNYVGNNTGYAEGIFVVSGRIDYELLDVIFINVSVTDLMTKHNKNTTYASLTVNIIDINDNYPCFNEIKAITVDENQISGSVVGFITATDNDGPYWNQVSYFIKPVNGTEDNLLQIDEKTGEIRIKKDRGIDAEEYEYLYYNVTATDGELQNTTQIDIYVNDINDNEPYVIKDKFNSTVHIWEKSPNGTEIVTIYAKDLDRSYPNNNVSYLINSNYSAPFEYFYLDKYSGLLRISLTESSILDRDFGAKSHTLNLKIRDNYIDNNTWNSNAIDTTVTVILDDINDQIPKLREVTSPIIVNEYTNQGISVTNITIDDYDDPTTNNTKAIFKILNMTLTNQVSENNEQEESLQCNNPFKVITVDYTYANILTSRPLFGCYGTWALELYAQDLGTYPGPLNDTKIYSIYIRDYNYNSPKILNPSNKQKIALSKNQTLCTTLKAYDGQPLEDFTAHDSDHGESGVVTFQISSFSDDHRFFKIINKDTNSAQLQLAELPNTTKDDTYKINLTATDHGTPSKSVSHEFSVIFVSALGPKFDVNVWPVWIKENTSILDPQVNIPEAHDNIGGSNTISIYYFIDNKVGDHEFFQLNKTTRELSLKKILDREEKETMMIQVIATTDSSGPPRDPEEEAILNITIIVVDINDNPPIFQSKFYSAGVATGDPIDNTILTVKAKDVDLNDTLTYYINDGSMNISDPSLAEAATKNPFILDPNSGDLLLKFSPSTTMVGYFSLAITVYDAAEHTDSSLIQVYLVSQDNRVEFTFRNSPSYVSEQKLFIIETFYNAFKYRCNIDKIRGTATAKNSLNNETIITTHFIDSENHLPITAEVVVLASGNLQILTNLKALLQSKSLYLIDVPTGSSSTVDDTEQTVLWVLLTFTIFFGLCTIALIAAYVTRIVSLRKRLDRVATAKEVESIKKSDDVKILPTTNNFALSGSNPIWNLSKSVIDSGDNISQTSGNSDLIGIETDPHFNYDYNNKYTFKKSVRDTEKMNEILAERPKIILTSPFAQEYPQEDNKC